MRGMEKVRLKKISMCVIAVLAIWTVSSVRAVPPVRTENAALLYYQAFLGSEEVRSRWHMTIDQINRDHDLGKNARMVVTQDSFQRSIELANIAVEIPMCDWGLLSSVRCRGDRLVDGKARGLGSLLLVDARVLASEGEYLPAFESAMRLRHFAGHIGDETYLMWVTSISVDSSAFRLIQDVLCVMPSDVDTLKWLKRQIARGPCASWRPRDTLRKWRDLEIRGWQACPTDYAGWLPGDGEEMPPSVTVESLRMAYDLFLESALRILESDVAYDAKYARISQLMDRIADRAKTDNDTAIMISAMRWWAPYYQQHALSEALNNAVKAGVEIYFIRAQTGQLPASLPEGLPKDPFSGKDFEYRVTDGGFTLCCRVAPIDYEVPGGRLRMRQYDFRITK